MLGLHEAIKNLWTIVDSAKTDAKEKLKAITLMREFYKERLDLIRSELSLLHQKKYMEDEKDPYHLNK